VILIFCGGKQSSSSRYISALVSIPTMRAHDSPLNKLILTQIMGYIMSIDN
jgi:hypothetical protein